MKMSNHQRYSIAAEIHELSMFLAELTPTQYLGDGEEGRLLLDKGQEEQLRLEETG